MAQKAVEVAIAAPTFVGTAVSVASPEARIAATLTIIYTAGLITRWWWRYIIRPFCERKGWLQPKKRMLVKLTESEWDQLQEDRHK